jgi:hypothetical protein
MTVRKRINHQGHVNFSENEKKERPLFSRAWTLQEELLALRVLYFDPEEVIFQCRTALECQCGTIEREDRHSSPTTKQEFESVRSESSPVHEVQNSWRRVVENYSGRYLTRQSDRFSALSGLAKSFENRGLGEFVAGLWTNDLPLWLTWQSSSWTSEPIAPRQDGYVAPSWSWASRPAGDAIHYTHHFTASDVEIDFEVLQILDTTCEPAGLDPMGAIRSASLRVRGRMAPTTFRFWPHDKKLRNESAWLRVERDGWETRVTVDDLQHDGETAALDGKTVFCLPICLVKPQYHSEKAYYLVLCNGDQPGHYRRIGIGYSAHVFLIEDCERSPVHRLYLQSLPPKSGPVVRSSPIMKQWFDDAEEQEITLV